MRAEISHIGSAGDGVAAGDTPLHISRTLPGETVRVQPQPGGRRATLLEVVAPSPDRVQPPCPHFCEGCGGCALQHWDDDAYAGWKRHLVVAALERAGFARPPVGQLARTAPATRRRMDFAAERTDGGLLLGLHAAHATSITDLHSCHVLHPDLVALLPPLRQTLRGLAALRRRGSVLANLLADGPDLLIRTDGPLAPTDRAKLADFATRHDIRRIAWSPEGGGRDGGTKDGASKDAPQEIAFQLGAPYMLFGGHRVEPPPGVFLQASPAGEAAIVAATLAALPSRLTGRSRAMELYAGCGTISFPLSGHLRVQAYEGDAQAAASVRRAQSGTRVEMTHRDLARQPLSGKEMAGAAMVVLDPPYAGAAAQVAQIASSSVPLVVYVSCNPGALARDAGVLAQAGYRLSAATPIDQFLWSAQVECVAVFEK